MKSKKMRYAGHMWGLPFFFHFARGLNLQPAGQIWPIACFCTACKLRTDFTFLHDWKTNQKKDNIAYESQDSVSLSQSDWNRVMSIHCHSDYGYFCVTTTELSSGHRGHGACKAKNVYAMALPCKSLLTLH